MNTALYKLACTVLATIMTLFAFGQRHNATEIDRVLEHSDTMSVESLTSQAYNILTPEKVQQALALYKTAVARYNPSMSERDCYFSVIATINIGYIYLFFYLNPEQAYPYLARGLKIAKEHGFTSLIPGALDNLAKVHGDYGDTDTELSMLKEAFATTLRDDQGPVYSIKGMRYHLRVMVFMDMVMTAVRHNRLADIAEETDIMSRTVLRDNSLAPYAHALAIAMKHILDEQYHPALKKMQSAGKLLTSGSDYYRNVVNHHVLMSYVYSRNGDKSQALLRLDSARTEAAANGIDDLIPLIYRQKAALLPDSSQYYSALASLARDSLYDVGSLVRIKNLENSVYIDELNQEAALKEERHRRSLYIIYALSGALLAIAAIGAVAVRRNRQLTQANRTLVRNIRQEADTREIERKLRHAIPVGEEEKMRVASCVRDIMESDPCIYDPDFSLDTLASITGTKPKYLSTIINEVFGRNLSSLLAEARIREACRKLADPSTASVLTIDAIAESVGYKSRTHFSALFKRITGVTPSRYAAIAASDTKQNEKA